jgi:hypothetical protein
VYVYYSSIKGHLIAWFDAAECHGSLHGKIIVFDGKWMIFVNRSSIRRSSRVWSSHDCVCSTGASKVWCAGRCIMLASTWYWLLAHWPQWKMSLACMCWSYYYCIWYHTCNTQLVCIQSAELSSKQPQQQGLWQDLHDDDTTCMQLSYWELILENGQWLGCWITDGLCALPVTNWTGIHGFGYLSPLIRIAPFSAHKLIRQDTAVLHQAIIV